MQLISTYSKASLETEQQKPLNIPKKNYMIVRYTLKA
jgi:hypothetical protein